MSTSAPGTEPNGLQDQGGSAPWQADLEQRFADEGTRQVVDQYLRERWQPRVTQLEQQNAVNRDALNLYEAFREDPSGTYVAVTEQLYGPEQAQRLIAALSGEEGAEAQQEAQQQVQQATEQAQQEVVQQQVAALSDDDRQLLDSIRNEKHFTEYSQAVDQLIDGSDLTPAQAAHAKQFVHPFVVSADGNLEEGLARYKAAFQGVQFPDAPAVNDEAVAPPVIDGQGGASTPYEPQQKHSWDSAFDSFGEDLKRSNHPTAPPVGMA